MKCACDRDAGAPRAGRERTPSGALNSGLSPSVSLPAPPPPPPGWAPRGPDQGFPPVLLQAGGTVPQTTPPAIAPASPLEGLSRAKGLLCLKSGTEVRAPWSAQGDSLQCRPVLPCGSDGQGPSPLWSHRPGPKLPKPMGREARRTLRTRGHMGSP